MESREEQRLWQEGEGPPPCSGVPRSLCSGLSPSRALFPRESCFPCRKKPRLQPGVVGQAEFMAEHEHVRGAGPWQGFGRSQTRAGAGGIPSSLLSSATKAGGLLLKSFIMVLWVLDFYFFSSSDYF